MQIARLSMSVLTVMSGLHYESLASLSSLFIVILLLLGSQIKVKQPPDEVRRRGGHLYLKVISTLQGDSSDQELGWMDLIFGCSTTCPILLGLMGIWQKWLASCSKIVEHPNQSQPNPDQQPDLEPDESLHSSLNHFPYTQKRP